METSESGTTSSKEKVNRTLRLVFEYEDNNVRLVSQQSVTMVPPPPTAIRGPEVVQAGFWYELRDDQDRLMYYRVAANPIPVECEVFSEDPNESICRQEVEVTRGTFVLLAPDIREVTSIVLFGPPLQPTDQVQGTTELGRFNLARDRKE